MPWVQLREPGTGHWPGAGRHGKVGIAENEQRANEDTDGSWLTFGPGWKPGLKSRGRAGGTFWRGEWLSLGFALFAE